MQAVIHARTCMQVLFVVMSDACALVDVVAPLLSAYCVSNYCFR